MHMTVLSVGWALGADCAAIAPTCRTARAVRAKGRGGSGACPLTLRLQRRLARLILRDLVHGMLLAFLAESLLTLRNVDLR